MDKLQYSYWGFIIIITANANKYTIPCHKCITIGEFKEAVFCHDAFLVVSAIFQALPNSGGNVIYKFEDWTFTII